MTVPTTNNNITTNTKRLSVQVSLNGLSFLVLDTTENHVLFLHEVHFPETLQPEMVEAAIKKEHTENKELQDPFSEVLVYHENQLATLVPKPLFQENALSSYLSYNTRLLPTDYISFDSITMFDVVLVYVPYANVNNYFFETYGSFPYKHTTTAFLEKVLPKETSGQDATMYVHVYSSHIDIVVTENKKILLCNSFSFHSPEDFLYYILFVAEQLQLDPEVFPLYFSGKINKESAAYKLAYQYIRNCFFMPDTSKYTWAEKQTPLDSNSLFLLLP